MPFSEKPDPLSGKPDLVPNVLSASGPALVPSQTQGEVPFAFAIPEMRMKRIQTNTRAEVRSQYFRVFRSFEDE